MEIKHWQRMMGHKLVEHKVPKTEPRMDVSDAYVVDPSLVHQISKGMLTLPRMHETPKGLTQVGTVTSLPNESDHRPTLGSGCLKNKSTRRSGDYWMPVAKELEPENKFVMITATSPHACCRKTKGDAYRDPRRQRVPKLAGKRQAPKARFQRLR